MSQNDVKDVIPPTWILLNTCSTASVTNDESFIENIRTCSNEENLKLSTNGGPISFNQIGHLKFLDIDVYYNPKSMAIVLSLSDVVDLDSVQMTMDTLEERAILVHLNDKIIKFQECNIDYIILILQHCLIKQ